MAYGAISLTDVQQDLAFLEGNQTVPSSGIDDWNRFIQRSLEEAWRMYPWDFAKTLATVTMTSGVGTLASGVLHGGLLDVRAVVSGTGDDRIYTQIPFEEKDDWAQGTYRYWVTGTPYQPVINTVETDGTLQVWYSSMAPQINASVTAAFPDAMIIALGAQRYIRKSENPQADTSQEEQTFLRRLEDLYGQQNRTKPRKARRFYPDITTGQVGGD